MNEDIKTQDPETVSAACGCGEGGQCDTHKNENMFTKHRGSEEIALAFLLALTPLMVLTFFGQVGLL